MKKSYLIFLHVAVFLLIGLIELNSVSSQYKIEEKVFEMNMAHTLRQSDKFQFEGCVECMDVLKENGLKGHVLSAIFYDQYLKGYPKPASNYQLVEYFDMEPREGNENPVHPMENVEYDPTYLLSMDVDSMSSVDSYAWSKYVIDSLTNNELDRSLIDDQQFEKLAVKIKSYNEFKYGNKIVQIYSMLRNYYSGEALISGEKIYL